MTRKQVWRPRLPSSASLVMTFLLLAAYFEASNGNFINNRIMPQQQQQQQMYNVPSMMRAGQASNNQVYSATRMGAMPGVQPGNNNNMPVNANPATSYRGQSPDGPTWNLTSYLNELSNEIGQVDAMMTADNKMATNTKPVARQQQKLKQQQTEKRGLKNFHSLGHFTTGKLGETKSNQNRLSVESKPVGYEDQTIQRPPSDFSQNKHQYHLPKLSSTAYNQQQQLPNIASSQYLQPGGRPLPQFQPARQHGYYQSSYPHQFQPSSQFLASVFSQPTSSSQSADFQVPNQETKQQQQQYAGLQQQQQQQSAQQLMYQTQQQAAVPQQFKGFSGSSAYLNKFQAAPVNEKQQEQSTAVNNQQLLSQQQQQAAVDSAWWNFLNEAAEVVDALEETTAAPVTFPPITTEATTTLSIDELLNEVELSLEQMNEKRMENNLERNINLEDTGPTSFSGREALIGSSGAESPQSFRQLHNPANEQFQQQQQQQVHIQSVQQQQQQRQGVQQQWSYHKAAPTQQNAYPQQFNGGRNNQAAANRFAQPPYLTNTYFRQNQMLPLQQATPVASPRNKESPNGQIRQQQQNLNTARSSQILAQRPSQKETWNGEANEKPKIFHHTESLIHPVDKPGHQASVHHRANKHETTEKAVKETTKVAEVEEVKDEENVKTKGEKEMVEIGTAEVAADEKKGGNDNSDAATSDKAAETVTASTEHAVLGPRVLAISSGKRESFHYAYDEPNENQGFYVISVFGITMGCVLAVLGMPFLKINLKKYLLMLKRTKDTSPTFHSAKLAFRSPTEEPAHIEPVRKYSGREQGGLSAEGWEGSSYGRIYQRPTSLNTPYTHRTERVVRTESLIDVDDPEAEDYEGGGFQGEDEDDDTIYECPGLAPPGEMVVTNPFFLDKELCNISSDGAAPCPVNININMRHGNINSAAIMSH